MGFLADLLDLSSVNFVYWLEGVTFVGLLEHRTVGANCCLAGLAKIAHHLAMHAALIQGLSLRHFELVFQRD
jgi:hypothetical protein